MLELQWQNELPVPIINGRNNCMGFDSRGLGEMLGTFIYFNTIYPTLHGTEQVMIQVWDMYRLMDN
jgi:hypothetical protein